MTELEYCRCAGKMVGDGVCQGCEDDDFWTYDDDGYEEPPPYAHGKLASMTLEQLEQEFERQCDRQGRLGDAERIDDRAVEETEARCRLVAAEIKRRKAAE